MHATMDLEGERFCFFILASTVFSAAPAQALLLLCWLVAVVGRDDATKKQGASLSTHILICHSLRGKSPN